MRVCRLLDPTCCETLYGTCCPDGLSGSDRRTSRFSSPNHPHLPTFLSIFLFPSLSHPPLPFSSFSVFIFSSSSFFSPSHPLPPPSHFLCHPVILLLLHLCLPSSSRASLCSPGSSPSLHLRISDITDTCGAANAWIHPFPSSWSEYNWLDG